MEGNIIQLQDFSVHDGDGIRTTIFFAGCPLRCRWCANPESWTQAKKLAFFQEKCTGCGLCAQVCPGGLLQGLDRSNDGTYDSSGTGSAYECAACGLCVKRCPQGALSIMGEAMTVDQIEAQVLRDSLFYGLSGGGVTFSGGEATVQTDFLRELSERLYNRGISMWLETCGAFSFEEAEDILVKLDHIFFDLKLMDSAKHREMTGVGNEELLENCRRVFALGIPMTLRIPCIPEVNMTEENLSAAARFIVQNLPGAELELLPYHAYGVQKYRALRMGEPAEFTVPSEEAMKQAEELCRSKGVNVVRYR